MPRRPKHAGIYQIELDGFFYIGKSNDVFLRWSSHLTDLFYKRHHNKPLQEHFDVSNYRNLKFTILKICSKKELSALEKELIQNFPEQDKLLNVSLRKNKKVSDTKQQK